MWESIYDRALQATAMPWNEYIYKFKSCGRIVQSDFLSKIYSVVGFEMAVISFLFFLLYYYYFNYRFGRYYSVPTWLVTMGLNSIAVGLVTALTARSILADPACDVFNQLLWISIINGFYAAVAFLFFSILFKWWSPMAKRTPF